jgi:hypothetical protein
MHLFGPRGWGPHDGESGPGLLSWRSPKHAVSLAVAVGKPKLISVTKREAVTVHGSRPSSTTIRSTTPSR